MQVPTASASSNAAISIRLITQFNNCDESGLGSSSAVCSNFALNTISGPLTVRQGSGSYSSELGIAQEANQGNNCNESGDGSSNAVCTNTASNNVGNIIYVNQGSGTFSNSADINQGINQGNNCNESGDGRQQCQDVQTQHPIE